MQTGFIVPTDMLVASEDIKQKQNEQRQDYIV